MHPQVGAALPGPCPVCGMPLEPIGQEGGVAARRRELVRLAVCGVLAIVLMFFWLTRRAFEIGRLAIRLDRTFAGLVAQGVGLWLGLQAFINMGVNLGLLPTKGLTLPLMSYGGSGILANCVAVAILLRVDFENRMLMRGAK
jgi:cell division protein FtsW